MSGPTMVLERLSRVTPLGIRFWDEAIHSAVSEGLAVEVYPKGQPGRRASARPNRIGTFVLPRLPGPREPAEEFGSGDPEFWNNVRPRPYILEVSDTRGYYQPFTLELLLPARGLAVPSQLTTASPPLDVVTLFPTSSRPVPSGMAVVRADLRTPVAGPGGRTELAPASWALVEVQAGTTAPVRGLADRKGRVAIVLPYPEPRPSPARPTSPPYAAGTSLREQEWPVRLSIFFEPATPVPVVPDLQRTLEQLPAMAWIDEGPRLPLGDQVLRYGQELVVRSVVVIPAGSPP